MHQVIPIGISGLNKLLAGCSEAIFLLNTAFEITYQTPSRTLSSGLPYLPQAGRRFIELVHADYTEKITDVLAGISQAAGRSETSVFRWPDHQNRPVWARGIFTNMTEDADIGAIVCHVQEMPAENSPVWGAAGGAEWKPELRARRSLEEVNEILESIGDGFFALDQNWTVTYWNNMAETVLGKPKEQVWGQNLWEVFPESVGSQSYMKYYQAFTENQSVHFEDFYPPLQKWYEISAYPSPKGLSVYFRDITERKRLNSALEESKKNYISLFESCPLPMWVFDLETLRFLDVNQAAIDHYQYTKEEFLAMSVRDIRPYEEIPILEAALSFNPVTRRGEKKGIFRHRKKNGEIVQTDIQTNLIQYEGRPAMVTIANDMTERFAYVQAIEHQNAKLREIAFMQSHVVRAPLARIMGIVSMLQDLDLREDERQQLLDFLEISANEMDGIVKQISDKTI